MLLYLERYFNIEEPAVTEATAVSSPGEGSIGYVENNKDKHKRTDTSGRSAEGGSTATSNPFKVA